MRKRLGTIAPDLAVESPLREYRDDLIAAIADDEWELLFQAVQQQSVIGDENYQILLGSMFLFEYRYERRSRVSSAKIWLKLSRLASDFKSWGGVSIKLAIQRGA